MLSKCGLFKKAAKSVAQSRVGVPLEISNRTVSTDASVFRRTSLMSHVASFSILIPVCRSNDLSENEINCSMFNQKQSTQFNVDENLEISTPHEKQ